MAGLHSLLRVTADLVARIGPILLFLVFATVLAGLCAGLGFFDLVADAVVHAAHGSVRRVWAGLVAVAVASTALLPLDTTAVLCGAVVMPAWCGGVTCSTCGGCRGCWLAVAVGVLFVLVQPSPASSSPSRRSPGDAGAERGDRPGVRAGRA